MTIRIEVAVSQAVWSNEFNQVEYRRVRIASLMSGTVETWPIVRNDGHIWSNVAAVASVRAARQQEMVARCEQSHQYNTNAGCWMPTGRLKRNMAKCRKSTAVDVGFCQSIKCFLLRSQIGTTSTMHTCSFILFFHVFMTRNEYQWILK